MAGATRYLTGRAASGPSSHPVVLMSRDGVRQRQERLPGCRQAVAAFVPGQLGLEGPQGCPAIGNGAEAGQMTAEIF